MSQLPSLSGMERLCSLGGVAEEGGVVFERHPFESNGVMLMDAAEQWLVPEKAASRSPYQ